MQPALTMSGSFGTRPMSASEGSKFIRDVCETLGIPSEGFSTHSLKVLYLSWAAKAHLPLDDRSILGYHVLPHRTSTFVYGRDNMSGPLRSLDEVLNNVLSGHFNPDSSRSGYFKKPKTLRAPEELEPAAAEKLAPAFLEPKAKTASRPPIPISVKQEEPSEYVIVSSDSECSDAASSGSSSSSSDSDSEKKEVVQVWNGLAQRQAPRPDPLDVRDKFYYNINSHTLHSVSERDNLVTTCGRRLTSAFQELFEEPTFEFPKCRVCFQAT